MENKIPDIINKTTVDGKDVSFNLYLANSFDLLTQVTQEYAIVLNDNNEILLVSAINQVWQLPGGTVEKDESLIETLLRELDEETAILPNLNSIKPFFYQNVYWLNEDGSETFKGTQIRYICRPEVIKEFKADPDGDHIVNHRWTKLEELDTYLKWGPTAKFIQEYLPDYL